MTRKLLKLAYPSFQRFTKDYDYIKRGMLFVPMKNPLPVHTMLHVQIVIPGVEESFNTHGEIIKSYNHANPQDRGMMSGVMLALDGFGDSLKAEIEMALKSHEQYRKLLELDPKENPPENANIRETESAPADQRAPTSPQSAPEKAAAPPDMSPPPPPPAVDWPESGGIAMSADLLDHLDGKSFIGFGETVSPSDTSAPPPEEVHQDTGRSIEANDSERAEPNRPAEPAPLPDAPPVGLTGEDALVFEWIRETAAPGSDISDTGVLLDPHKMATDIRTRAGDYIQRIRRTESKGEALVFLKWFQRAVPVLIEGVAWPILRDIIRLANQVAANKAYFPDLSNPTINPFVLAVYDHTDTLAAAYENEEGDGRAVIDELVDELGYVGVKILSDILHDSEKREARTAAVDAFERKGNMALHWVRMLLDDPDKKWYLYRNGLLILSHVGDPDADMDRVRPFLEHSHERVREEALKTTLVYNPPDIGGIIITFLKDPDRSIRDRASQALDQVADLSNNLFSDIMAFLLADPPKDLSEASGYYRACSLLILFIGDREPIPHQDQFESVLMKMVVKFMKMRKWFAILVNTDEYEEINGVLVASSNILERIGSPRGRAFLREMKSPGKQ